MDKEGKDNDKEKAKVIIHKDEDKEKDIGEDKVEDKVENEDEDKAKDEEEIIDKIVPEHTESKNSYDKDSLLENLNDDQVNLSNIDVLESADGIQKPSEKSIETENSMKVRIPFLSNDMTDSDSTFISNLSTKTLIRQSIFTGATGPLTIDEANEQFVPHQGIVRLPLERESYKIDGTHRKEYPTCEYHFPRSIHLVRKFFYDSERNKCLSRRPKSWIYTFVFFIAFVYFMIYFGRIVFRRFVLDFNLVAPQIKMKQPYLSFAPIGRKSNYRLIEYDMTNRSEVKHMRDKVTKFLERHGHSDYIIKRFGPCQIANSFGYDSWTPCVFIKINRLLGFKTQAYKRLEDLNIASFDMVHYDSLMNFVWNATEKQLLIDYIWLTCDSKPFIRVEYFPKPAFNSKYVDVDRFPYIKAEDRNLHFNSKLDMNRLVAVRLNNLKLGQTHKFTFKIWAQNIENNRPDLGQVMLRVHPKNPSTTKKKHQHDAL